MPHRLKSILRLSFIVVLWLEIVAPSFAQDTDANYAPVIPAVHEFVKHEFFDKGIPGLSIALVDNQEIIWASGYGWADPKKNMPANHQTIYRVGSVSKLFTDIAVMQLVEKGEIDLDAPIAKHLPPFRPQNPFNKPITLRQLMSHRAGLVRESPIGNYFDSTEPSLEQTVMSLNQSELVYEPGARTKYSNAGIATVGYVLERLKGEKYEPYIQKAVLDRIGMGHSSYERSPAIAAKVAKATMWRYDGKMFDAPTFQLGTGPAGNLFSTVEDLSKFLSMLFNGGIGEKGRVLLPTTIAQMWVPQFGPASQRTGYGLGFAISDLDGFLRVGHGGAVYGFSTELAALPEEKIGVVVAASMDVVNNVLRRIADFALRQMLAARRTRLLEPLILTQDVTGEALMNAPGTYSNGRMTVDLLRRGVKLMLQTSEYFGELRMLGDTLITDNRLDYGLKLYRGNDWIRWGDRDTLWRTERTKPQPVPEKWKGLIGEYGWDHNTLYIHERRGKLTALIEWIEFDPLEEISPDVFAFPGRNMYVDEKLVFHRDQNGKATEVVAAGILFKHRHLDGEDGETFKITPLKSADELRKIALAAKPPVEQLTFLKPELVELRSLDSSIQYDIRYATTNNFMGVKFYSEARAFLQRPAAVALVRVHRALKDKGYGLLIHDAYRPWYVTKMFWDATPDSLKIFVADPMKGSRHNRGCAVDLTLCDLKTGKAVEMVSGYDEFSDRAFPDYMGGTSLQRWYRELLREAMESEGFQVYDWEWWHFDYKDWQHYPIGTARFEEIK